jgi:hypothetical protein
MEAKLAEYRAKKAKEKSARERKEKLWKIVTFEGNSKLFFKCH